MNSKLILKLVIVCLAGFVGACADMTRLPNGDYWGVHGASNLNHASSYAARWRPTDKKDAEGKPLFEEVMEPKIVGTKPDGTPIIVMVKAGETISGPSVAGQMAVGVVTGMGVAGLNGSAVRAVARIGKCPDGSGAICGTVINANAYADAAAQNKGSNTSNTNVGATPAPSVACKGKKDCTD